MPNDIVPVDPDSGIVPAEPERALDRRPERTLFPLPQPVDNAQRLCIKVWIPNTPAHRRAFVGAISNLAHWYSWQRDEAKTARLAAQVWRDVLNQMLDHFYDGCDDCGEECFDYSPDSPIIEWFPNDPYTQPDLVTEGYNYPAWYQATPLSNTILGTASGDVLTDLTRFPPGSLPTILPASGLPRFRVTLEGEAVVRLYLVNIFGGSIAQVTIDDNPLSVQLIDLNRDTIGLPPETLDSVVVELKTVGMGVHHIDCIIVSQINDQIPFLHHGGGLRKVQICGGNADMAWFQLRQNPNDPCQLQQQLVRGGDWSLAFDYGLCDNGSTKQITRIQDQQKTIINRQYTTIYDGTPGSINPSAPTTSFSDSSDRETALCMAAVRYVSERMGDAWIKAREELLLEAAFYSNPITRTLLEKVGGLTIVPGGVTPEAAIQAAENGSAIKDASCALADALKGTAINEAAFFTGIDSLSGTGDIATIYTILKASRARANYLYFLDLLGEAWDMVQAGVDDCPCSDEWCYEVDFALGAGGFAAVVPGDNIPRAIYTASGWKSIYDQAGLGVTEVRITRSLPSSAQFTRVEVTLSSSFTTSDFVTFNFATQLPNSVGQNVVSAADVTLSADNLRTDISYSGSQGGEITIHKIKYFGTGTNPFGANNCT